MVTILKATATPTIGQISDGPMAKHVTEDIF